MVPSEEQAKKLWEKYRLPQAKRVHVALVARVAVFFAQKLRTMNYQLRTDLLRAAVLLHDIDKVVPKLPGETHPDTAVRILEEEGMSEVAGIVKTHSLHAILDPKIAPRTWEEKLLYLSDKMVKYEIIGVDARFALWNSEPLSDEAKKILAACYPKVKELEQEVCALIGIKPENIAKLA